MNEAGFSSQAALWAAWLVASARDVADAVVVVRGARNAVLLRRPLPYHRREVTLPLEGEVRRAVASAEPDTLQLCVLPMTSEERALEWHEAQCAPLPGQFASWPRKLALDKRRLSARRPQRPHHSAGGALALVADSLLLTLCIFLGVCFRRLADLDV